MKTILTYQGSFQFEIVWHFVFGNLGMREAPRCALLFPVNLLQCYSALLGQPYVVSGAVRGRTSRSIC